MHKWRRSRSAYCFAARLPSVTLFKAGALSKLGDFQVRVIQFGLRVSEPTRSSAEGAGWRMPHI